MRIDTTQYTFDMKEMNNRCFMFNPETGTLILGRTSLWTDVTLSPVDEYTQIGIKEPFNDFICGWVGTGGDYKEGVIHFAPPILQEYTQKVDKGFSALEMFAQNGATNKTVIRGFPGEWEQPLENVISSEKLNENKIANIPDIIALYARNAEVSDPRCVGSVILMTPVFDEGNFNRTGKRIRVTVEEPAGKYQLFSRDEFNTKMFYFLTASGRIDRLDGYFNSVWNEQTHKRESYRPTEADIDEVIPKIAERFESDMADPTKWALYQHAAVLNRLDDCETHNNPIRELRNEERKIHNEKEEIKRQEEQRQKQEKYDNRVGEIAKAIEKGEVISVKYDEYEFGGKNPVLDLFKLYDISLPLRTQGWVNTGLAEITESGYRYYKSKQKGNSSSFSGYLKKLREAIKLTPIEQKRQYSVEITEVNKNMQYSELQQKGFEIAKKYENLPLQDRLNIIAKTFGCKTASIETIPCGGKYRGYSDIMLTLDNGASLGIGMYGTAIAKDEKTINECVNNTLARYNPEIVGEIKERAFAAIKKLETEDNAVSAQMGLKPYKFLNVELSADHTHIGWYYVTLAVDNKIFSFVESGLNSDIARGVLGEDISRPEYFVAGGLKESEVNFVFNNVGHSSFNGSHQVNISNDAYQRAEKTLKKLMPAEEREAEFLNYDGDAYGIYLFEPKLDDNRIIKENYRLAWFGKLDDGETLDTIRDRFNKEEQPFYDYIPRENNIKFGSGDIIVMKQNGEITPWYMDILAYSKQNNFFKEVEIKNTDIDNILPDSKIGLSERDLYGYKAEEVLPLLKDRALELFDADHTIYMLYNDNTEAMIFERNEILNHDGIFGIDAADWITSQEYSGMIKAMNKGEASKEAAFIFTNENFYAIYQLKHSENTRDYRFEPFDRLESKGLKVEQKNYELVYTGILDIRDTQTNLHKIYKTFQAENPERPADFNSRSVSVSDVIVMKWRDNISSHYVDDVGFIKLPVFLGDEIIENIEKESGKSHEQSAPPQNKQIEKDNGMKNGKSSILSQLQRNLDIVAQGKETEKNLPKPNNKEEV